MKHQTIIKLSSHLQKTSVWIQFSSIIQSPREKSVPLTSIQPTKHIPEFKFYDATKMYQKKKKKSKYIHHYLDSLFTDSTCIDQKPYTQLHKHEEFIRMRAPESRMSFGLNLDCNASFLWTDPIS